MSEPDANTNSFVKPVVVDVGGDLTDLCRRIRRSLATNHAHCPEADRIGLADQLLLSNSRLKTILGEGFRSLVIFDARYGLTPKGVFDLRKFLHYLSREMAAAFDLELDGQEFHPEEISQILKDETHMSLFCFVGIQHIPYGALQRLRGFTQEGHRCLFCGDHDFGRHVVHPVPGSNRDFELELDDDGDTDEIELPLDDSDRFGSILDEEVSLGGGGGRRRAPDSDIGMVMDTISIDADDDEPIELAGDQDLAFLDDFDSTADGPEDSGVSLVVDMFDFSVSVPGDEFLKSPLFDDRDRKLAAMAHQASIWLSRQQFETATEWLQALESASGDDIAALCVCRGLQADTALAQKDWPAAFDLLQQQQTLFELSGRKVPLAACLRKQATLLSKQGQLDEALALLEEECQIFDEIGLGPEHARSFALQAQLQAARNDADAALTALRQQERICRLQALHDQLLECLGQQSQVLRHTNDLGLALATLHEQVRIAEELGRQDITAVARGHQAAIHESRGDFAVAAAYYQQGEQLCRQLALHELLARNLANQAFLKSAKMNEHQQALPLAEEAFTLASEQGLDPLAAQIKKIHQGIRARLK